MLQETEAEETEGFLLLFYFWWHFNWEGLGPLLPPPWLRLCFLIILQ